MDSKTKAKYEARARIMKAMSHPTRLFMVEVLSKGQRCVCELTKMVGSYIATISKHLSVLKSAGIVADEKRGTRSSTRCTSPACSGSSPAWSPLSGQMPRRRGRWSVEVRYGDASLGYTNSQPIGYVRRPAVVADIRSLWFGKHKVTMNELVAQHTAALVDVRSTEEEVQTLAMPFSHDLTCLHIRPPDIPSRMSEIPREQAMAVFCSAAIRAAIGYACLGNMGFEQVRVPVRITEQARPGGLWKRLSAGRAIP